MAIRILSRSIITTKECLSSVFSRSYTSFSIKSPPSALTSLPSFSPLRLRPLVSAAANFRHLSPVQTTSSLNDSNPNWSNRPPKETILLGGCDFEHWLVVVEKPEGEPTRDEIIDSYIKTLAKVIGRYLYFCEEEARMKIYSLSTRHYFAFGALVSEELSYKLKELEHVRWVLPDSYLDVKNKDYGEMRKIFGGRDVWVVGLSNRFRRPFSSTSNPNNNGNKVVVDGSLNQYRDLDKLDFMTASKILFSTPPKKKKFGIDFHLVQLFFACMPSLAVYLVAQYARCEMRRMEAELEVKKKAEEEAKLKEMELKASEEKESGSDAELKEVKTRLGKLEDAVKEIVVEGSKKQLGSSIPEKQEDGNGKKQSAAAEEQTSKGRTKGSGQQERSGSAPVT